jgi:ribonuclease III
MRAADLVTIFETGSDVEARVLQGMLEAHGIEAAVSSIRPAAFPLTIGSLGNVRVRVAAEQADEARALIERYRTEADAARPAEGSRDWDRLERRLGYRFRDRGLLEQALTHRSRAHEDLSGGVTDNESLEFLGDAVLGFVVADLLFRRFPDSTEGDKSKLKAALVSAPSLRRLAETLDLGSYLILGRGEEKTGGRHKPALVADSLEAVIAAIYLDGGIEPVRAFVARLVEEPLRTSLIPGGTLGDDYKSALQEWLQSRDRPLPEYRLAGQAGPDHARRFVIEVCLRGEAVARGEGRSKKEAEQNAAREALSSLGGREDS